METHVMYGGFANNEGGTNWNSTNTRYGIFHQDNYDSNSGVFVTGSRTNSRIIIIGSGTITNTPSKVTGR